MTETKIDLKDKRVLVTGGTGFIGGRLVERLVLDCGAKVRVLIRNLTRATRVARFPVEMINADLLDAKAVTTAAQDCDFVFHCAFGNSGGADKQRRVNVEGTRHVFDAALQSGVKRVVHLSTVSVYGALEGNILDESAPRRYSGSLYADSKLDAENLAFQYAQKQSLPVTILQPTIVYGPYATGWTLNILQQLKSERVILVNGGEGICNAVYVDDVVNAMLLAAVNDAAVGEAFLISGEPAVTWRDFYQSYEKILGVSSTVSKPAQEIALFEPPKPGSIFKEPLKVLLENGAVRRRIMDTVEVATLRKLGRAVLPSAIRTGLKRQITSRHTPSHVWNGKKNEKPLSLMDEGLVRFFSAKTTVRIDKAKNVLGYWPAFDLNKGMWLTEEWAQWANLL